jgi:hydroxymethylbilane synthase
MMPRGNIVIGTRGSGLALAQSTWVKEQLEKLHPRLRFEMKIIKTTGDRLQPRERIVVDPVFGPRSEEIAPARKAPKLAKGLFTKELEAALLRRHIHLAVHSLKDVPTELPAGLEIGAVPKRADVRDVIVTRGAAGLAALREGAVIATGSPRRRCELKRLRADLEFADIRGNIDTRLRKLECTPDWDAIVLAHAGLERLRPDTAGLVVTPLAARDVLPAPGQGALGIEVRADDEETRALLQGLNHHVSHVCAQTERAFLRGLGGGCEVPLGAYAWHEDGHVHFLARHHRADGCLERAARWPVNDAAAAALALARETAAA